MLKEMVKAKRRGFWFRLSIMERSIYSLALNLRINFQSYELIRAIVSILKKIKSRLHAHTVYLSKEQA